jgi:catechol 2,3-dioxygenase-like lactoylglutathione lyase family enzyme
MTTQGKRTAVAVAVAALAMNWSSAFAQSAPAAPPVVTNTIVGPGYYVSDMARSLRFYRDVLGMSVRLQFGPKDKPDVVVGFGPDPSKPSLMLLSDRSGAVARPIQHGHGYSRVALLMADVRDLSARLKAAGFSPGEIRVVHGSSLMMMVDDPDGYKIEIIDSRPVKP